MRVLFLLLMCIASWAEAFAGVALSGDAMLYRVHTNLRSGSQNVDSTSFVPFLSFNLGYEFSNGFALRYKNQNAPFFLGDPLTLPFALQTDSGPSNKAVLQPTAHLLEVTLPLFAPGPVRIGVAAAAGFTNWGAKPFQSSPLTNVASGEKGAFPSIAREYRFQSMDSLSLAYAALLNLEWLLTDSWSFNASGGYASLGSPIKETSSPSKFSIGGLTFSLGISLQL